MISYREIDQIKLEAEAELQDIYREFIEELLGDRIEYAQGTPPESEPVPQEEGVSALPEEIPNA